MVSKRQLRYNVPFSGFQSLYYKYVCKFVTVVLHVYAHMFKNSNQDCVITGGRY